MKVSDISDVQVVSACRVATASPDLRSLEVLVEATGAPRKVALRAMERAVRRDLIDWGVSIELAWPSFLADHPRV